MDTGALIAFENRSRPINVLIQRAKDAGLSITIPAGVLAQVWRDGSRQARLAALLGSKSVRIEDLNRARAKAVGELCGRAGIADVVDASVVLAARQVGGLVATSDVDDLHRIDPGLALVRV